MFAKARAGDADIVACSPSAADFDHLFTQAFKRLRHRKRINLFPVPCVCGMLPHGYDNYGWLLGDLKLMFHSGFDIPIMVFELFRDQTGI